MTDLINYMDEPPAEIVNIFFALFVVWGLYGRHYQLAKLFTGAILLYNGFRLLGV